MPISGKEPHKKIPFISPMVRVANLKNNSKEFMKRRCIECGERFESTIKYQEHLVVHDLINLCYTIVSDEKITGRSVPQLDMSYLNELYYKYVICHPIMACLQQSLVTSYASFDLVNFIDGCTAYTKKVDIQEISLEDGYITIKWKNPNPYFIKNIQLEFMQFAASPTFNPSFNKHEWYLLSRDAKEYKKMIDYGHECMLSIAFIDHDDKWFAHEVSHISYC